MNKFIRQILIYIVGGITAILILFFARGALHKPYLIDQRVDTVLLGDSHVRLAINDALSARVKNVSTNSEHYFFTYYKLKEVLKHNPHIKNVSLGLSYHNLSTYYDGFITGGRVGNNVSDYLYLIDVVSLLKLSIFHPDLIIHIVKANLALGKRDYPYIGRFPEREITDKIYSESSMKRRIKDQYFSGNVIRGISSENIDYLTEIVKLCKNSGVNLNFINTPLHSNFQNAVPEIHARAYEDLIDKFNLPVIDFKDVVFSDSHFLPDGDHLNSRGARIATDYYNQRIDP